MPRQRRGDVPALSRALGQEHVPVELYDLKARLLRWMTETEDPILQGAITPPYQVQALQALKEP